MLRNRTPRSREETVSRTQQQQQQAAAAAVTQALAALQQLTVWTVLTRPANMAVPNNLLQQQRHRIALVSYNMHGFNQGQPALVNFLLEKSADIFMLQEHWLTPANLYKFDALSPDYFTYGSSAMSKSVETKMLVGRPFGGVMFMINNNLRSITEFICSADRYAIIRVADWIFVNVYLPCKGTVDRQLICEDILEDIWSHRDRLADCKFLIGGDFNVDLCATGATASAVNSFLVKYDLVCTDKSLIRKPTYVNEALNHESVLDYFFTSDDLKVSNYDVIDPDINFSDHLPITIICESDSTDFADRQSNCRSGRHSNNDVTQLRWDHADVVSYYDYTRINLQPVSDDVDNLLHNIDVSCDVRLNIDLIYAKLVNVLRDAAKLFVPSKNKSFFKFWWDESLDLLKQESIDTARVWKAAAKPRSGPIFHKYQAAKSAYRSSLRQHQRLETSSYTNDLHDALANKNGKNFWNCWRSKFEHKAKYEQVDGCIDKQLIAEKFAKHFSSCCSSVNSQRATELNAEYTEKRAAYYGTPLIKEDEFDVELVDIIISELKRGKAAGLDSLTAEHLQFSHPIVRCILAKLFNAIMLSGYVPISFGCSYTVPLIKVDGHARAVSCNDFRGISISPVVSKVFEHCILRRYKRFLITADNQFGFKSGLGCSHAINTVRCIVDRHIKGGSTVNICALDLSKAFDKMNHDALFIKLMRRNIPSELLCIFESWFSQCYTCVKWFGFKSTFYQITIGCRQGGVLSPFLFAVYLDDVVNLVCGSIYGSTLSIVLYADDIILLSPSVQALQSLIIVCESELRYLDMIINAKKSCCMRIGPRFNVPCAPIVTLNGDILPWLNEIRYLGVYIVSYSYFKCSLEYPKRSFYRSANAIFGKIGHIASEEVVLELIVKKCVPVLLYGLEACVLNITQKRSLNFTFNRLLMKLFTTFDINIISDVIFYFGLSEPSKLLEQRQLKFTNKYSNDINMLCKLCTVNC
jgi:exonuclease III